MLKQGYSAIKAITRPDDTTAYAAGDVVGGVIEFGPLGAPRATVMVLSASLRIDASAVIASETSYTLHLYSATPPSALADNAAWDLPAGDRSVYLGSIDLGTPADLGSTLWVETHTIQKVMKLDGADVFGYLVTDAGHTPTALRVYNVAVHTVM